MVIEIPQGVNRDQTATPYFLCFIDCVQPFFGSFGKLGQLFIVFDKVGRLELSS